MPGPAARNQADPQAGRHWQDPPPSLAHAGAPETWARGAPESAERRWPWKASLGATASGKSAIRSPGSVVRWSEASREEARYKRGPFASRLQLYWACNSGSPEVGPGSSFKRGNIHRDGCARER